MDNRQQKNSQKQKKPQKHKNNHTLSTITMVVSPFWCKDHCILAVSDPVLLRDHEGIRLRLSGIYREGR